MDEHSETPIWERRYRAATVSFPDWSPLAPDRIVYASNESGIWQIHCRDLTTGQARQVTDSPVGVTVGAPRLDGSGVLWFSDETGDESGRWYHEPFEGGEARGFLEGVPRGWNEGLAQAAGVVAAGISDRDGFGIYVACDGKPARELARSRESLQVAGAGDGFSRAGLSADGTLLCLSDSEAGGLLHPALRVVDAQSGAAVATLRDESMALAAAAWSPLPGDQRLAINDELEGHERPAIWEPLTGVRQRLLVDLPGDLSVSGWYPDGEAVLLNNLQEGRHHLYRYELANGGLMPIDHPAGSIAWGARVRPDGDVWYRLSQGHRGPKVLAEGGEEVLRAAAEAAPPGHPYMSWRFDNERGQSVHGFYAAPEGEGPFPVLMLVHGGPTSQDLDRYHPEAQSYVDAGFLVGMVNYRGSTGYGREWRDVLTGDIGGPELEDVNAGLRDLVGRGLADASRAVIGGWSWGGYVTLMELGKYPDLWLCGVAGVPVGDYELGYEYLSPLLQAYDRALLGGTPAEVPELMRDRNPINHADHVRAPVLFLIGENDSRCPYRQAMAYVERLAARDHPHELYVFGTGHGSNDLDEKVRQQRVILRFLAQHVPGIATV
ncbi:MAG: prolyl oligopeptidase family serine peptidase [Chloroflexota bacterium]|nr:prolyl oligopeptidase family serine peptidase [Chloroflexota bacterium]